MNAPSRFIHASFLLCLALSGKLSAATPFQPDDRWVAIGDSITHGGNYPRYLELFYVTRHPGSRLTYTNAGIAGDTTSGTVSRFDWDIAPGKPTVATVMLGMNDVGRDNYAPGKPDDDAVQKAREGRAAEFEKNMRSLVGRLRAMGTRVVLLSSTPYDDTSRMESPNLPGCNDALIELGRRTKAIAQETGTEFIDLTQPLTTLNRSLQAADPKFTLISNDRVHPGGPGYLAMTYEILRAQGVSGEVAVVHLDGAKGGVRLAGNCAVTDLVTKPESVAFTYTARSLPFPIPSAAAPAAKWIPFQTALNREELRVRGLSPGSYRMEIDQQVVGELSAADLERGVNLAELSTPQLKQAQAVLQTLEKRWDLMNRLRTIAAVEYQHGGKLPRPIDPKAIEPAIAAWEATLPPGHWQSKQPAQYRESKPAQAQIQSQAEELLRQARAEAVPKARKVTLTALKAN
ncbi:MAG TPA: SGNH/GDSL hydrolase family protein [Chthoniobacteraceae bacterium]|jgi:lysophospholipase L1-like esterase